MIFKFLNHVSLSNKIRLLLLTMALPFAIVLGLMLFMFTRYIGQYDQIVYNLTTASEFSIDFKKDIDAKTYKYVISKKNFEEYGMLHDIEQARGITQRLRETTSRRDSLQRLDGISGFLDSLEYGILELRDSDPKEGKGYDWAMDRLDNNIRVLTGLLRDTYQEYIYYEVRNLQDVRAGISQEMSRYMVILGFITLVIAFVLFLLAFRTANSISKPLKKLRENVRMVSRGDFNIKTVDSEDDDVLALSKAFDKMVEQIGVLMENVKREQQNFHRIELQLLQEQIKPHFLYNTFDTIVWLAEDGQDKEVINVTSSLSRFFRSSLSRGEDIISIDMEIIHIRSYLEIQQVRYKDILSFDITIPPEIEHFTVPKLTLQPLVENALYHGIKNKRGAGKIMINGIKKDGMLIISVHDNGIGISPERLEKLRESLFTKNKDGFGMSNVWERLRLYYGERCRMEIDSTEGICTEVRVYFPATAPGSNGLGNGSGSGILRTG